MTRTLPASRRERPGPTPTASAPRGGANPTFNGASVTDTRTVGGAFSTTGNFSGALTLGTTGEGLVGEIPINVTLNYSADAVANRVVTANSVNFGRVIQGVNVSGTSILATTGDDADFTRVTVGAVGPDANGISATGGTNPTFNSASVTDTRTVGGTFATAGNVSGQLTLITTGEGLTGENPIDVALNYSADAVNNRTETATAVNLGRVLVGQTTARQSTTISSAPNADSLYTRTTLGASAQTATGLSNGSVTLGGGTAYQFGGANDAANSTTRGVTGSFTTAGTQNGAAIITPAGEGLTGEVINPIAISYTVDPVTMRVITDGATTNLGNLHNGAAVNATTNAFTTSGTHDMTTDLTVAAGTGTSNGLTLSGGPTTFNGTISSDTRNLSGNISKAGGGLTAGTFDLTVTGEGLAGEGSYSDVAITYMANVYTGQSVWAGTGTGGSWGTLASGFGINWGTNQGSPGLDANFTSTDTATFQNVTGQGAQLVTLDGASPSLNSLTFNAPATGYTLAQGSGGTLFLNGGAGLATVSDLAGTHTISAPVSLTTNANVNVVTGQVLKFTGGISGAGGLVILGAGTTVLSQSNVYTGGTTLSSGTLDVTGAGTLGAATGPLTVAGGTLDLGTTSQTVGGVAITGASTIQNGTVAGSAYAISAASGTATVSAVLAGAAALTKTGSSVLELNGANTYGGGTTISAGTVAVGNLSAFGTGNVTLSGGTLETGNGVHQINAASYSQTGGTLVLNLTGMAAGASPGYEFLHVTGTAALGGALQVDVASPYVPTIGDAFAFVQAGSITGSFSHVSTNLFSLSITQQGAGVIIGQLPFATLSGIAYTPNEVAIAKDVDASYQNGASSPAFQTLMGALNNLTVLGSSPDGLPDAFSQLSPARFETFAESTLINNAIFTTQMFDEYLAGQRSSHGDFLLGNGQLDSTGLTVLDPSIDPALAQLSCRLLAWSPTPLDHGMLSDTTDPIIAGIESKEMRPTITPDQVCDFNVFVLGNVVLSQNFSQADLPHADTTTGAVQVGADYRITPHLRAGATFGFGHTEADLDNNGSKATVDSYSPGGYLSFADQGWYANALGSYGFDSFTEDRHVSFGGLTGVGHGAPNGDQIVGDLDSGYDFQMKEWTFGPLIGMQYTHLGVHPFTEDGAAPVDLQVGRQDTNSLRSRLGGRVSYEFHSGKVILTPHLDVSWQHEFLDQNRGITSQFTSIGAGSFTVDTPTASRDSALIDGGLTADFKSGILIYLDYLEQAGQSNYFGQSVQTGVKIGF